MRYAWDGMHLVAAFGLLYLAWSWFRIARDFADGVARVEWSWTATLLRGERTAMIYERSLDPSGFWWCTLIKVAIHGFLTVLFLLLLLEA